MYLVERTSYVPYVRGRKKMSTNASIPGVIHPQVTEKQSPILLELSLIH